MSAAAFDTLATKADIFGLKRDLKELFAIGFAWYNHRTFSHLGWAFFKRTFVEDRPFLVMLLGGVVLLLALGLKLASR